MTDIVFKPERAHIVEGRGLYRAWMNRKPLDLLFRAKTAGEADQMFQYLLTEQTRGKTLFVDPELLKEQKENKDASAEKDEKAGDQKPSASDRPDVTTDCPQA